MSKRHREVIERNAREGKTNLPGMPGNRAGEAHWFKKGGDPRRATQEARLKGQRIGFKKVGNALNQLLQMKEDEIKVVRDADTSTVAEKLAAERVLLALSKSPRADKAFEQIVDRVEGKPHQSHSVLAAQVTSPERLLEDIQRELGALVSLPEVKRLGLDPSVPEVAEVIEVQDEGPEPQESKEEDPSPEEA